MWWRAGCGGDADPRAPHHGDGSLGESCWELDLQIDLRDSFIKDAGGNEKTFRGPLHCMVCGEEHYFHVGKKTTVCLGSHIDALVHQGAV